MSSFRIRPSFSHIVESGRDDTRRLILRALAAQAERLEVRAFPEFIGIHIAEKERRFWSPRLFLSLEPTPEGGTRIEGTYGPEIEVWGIFVYGYIAAGLLATFSGILGYAQTLVQSEPWGFWIVAGMGVVVTLLYAAAQLGQKLGARQTFQLHQAYEAAIGRPAEIS
ncbi:MAG: hypothetical protein HZA93_01130 [Verrucomicrobia bacterium]|nr:hypothetical protein [Verrucomicrobiota bacterium]